MMTMTSLVVIVVNVLPSATMTTSTPLVPTIMILKTVRVVTKSIDLF